MRLGEIEAVVRRMPRILAEQLLRRLRPDIVIAWGEVERITAIRTQELFHLLPLVLRGCVIEALDRIPDADYERRVLRRGVFPRLFVNSRLGLACSIAEDDEPETFGRGGKDTAAQDPAFVVSV